MPSKVKDQATAERAALNLQTGVEPIAGEPNTPAEKSTSEKLFPLFVTDDGGIINRPVKKYEDVNKPLPVPETAVTTEQSQTPQPNAPTAPVVLKPEELMGKMVKVKVDGVESDVSAEQVLKSYQLERHLNAQLMKLAEERATFERERAQQAVKAPVATPSVTPEPQKQTPKAQTGQKSPEVLALEAQIAMLQANVDQLGQAVAPTLRENGLKRLDQSIREKYGAEDFMEYAPKIQEWVDQERTKPENQNPQAQQFFLNSLTWESKFNELKLKDVYAKAKNPAPVQSQNAPALVTQGGAPVVITNQGKPVSIPTIEGSGGVPSRGNFDSNWTARARAAFDTARQTGRTDDWATYYRLKSEGSQG